MFVEVLVYFEQAGFAVDPALEGLPEGRQLVPPADDCRAVHFRDDPRGAPGIDLRLVWIRIQSCLHRRVRDGEIAEITRNPRAYSDYRNQGAPEGPGGAMSAYAYGCPRVRNE
jgi:hypothetical protein